MSNIIRFVGDIHGANARYRDIIDSPTSPKATVQVGDYGVGFVRNPVEFRESARHRFIRGNHDNPHLCSSQANWIEDGTVEGNIMYIGGASSIDRAWRTPELDWWEDEELSNERLIEIIEIAVGTKPEIMITHECPENISAIMCNDLNKRKFEGDYSRTRSALEVILKYHQPKLHIFGHWHVDWQKQIGPTQFVCLNILNYADVDTETCQVVNGPYKGY